MPLPTTPVHVGVVAVGVVLKNVCGLCWPPGALPTTTHTAELTHEAPFSTPPLGSCFGVVHVQPVGAEPALLETTTSPSSSTAAQTALVHEIENRVSVVLPSIGPGALQIGAGSAGS